jgi:hypothetical protein
METPEEPAVEIGEGTELLEANTSALEIGRYLGYQVVDQKSSQLADFPLLCARSGKF